MHQQVEKIFTQVFTSSTTPLELKAYVIKEAEIVNFFINATKSIAILTPPHNAVRKGNLAQLTNIANALKECISTEVELQSLVEEQTEWFEFDESFLRKANDNNNQDIGGLNQKKLDNDLFENKIEFDKELIPQKYEAFLNQRKEETNDDPYTQLLASLNARKMNQQQEQKETLSEAIQSYLDQGTAKEKEEEEEDKEIESEQNKENTEEPKVIEWKIPQPVKNEEEKNEEDHKEEEFGDYVTSNIEEQEKNENQEIQEEKIQEINEQKVEPPSSVEGQYYKNNYWTPDNGYLSKIDELMGEI